MARCEGDIAIRFHRSIQYHGKGFVPPDGPSSYRILMELFPEIRRPYLWQILAGSYWSFNRALKVILKTKRSMMERRNMTQTHGCNETEDNTPNAIQAECFWASQIPVSSSMLQGTSILYPQGMNAEFSLDDHRDDSTSSSGLVEGNPHRPPLSPSPPSSGICSTQQDPFKDRFLDTAILQAFGTQNQHSEQETMQDAIDEAMGMNSFFSGQDQLQGETSLEKLTLPLDEDLLAHITESLDESS